MNSRVCSKTQRLMFLLVSGGHICAHTASTNKALWFWVKTFPAYLAYEMSLTPDSWRGFLDFFMLFHFLDSGLSVLNGFDFYCWWRDNENRVFTRASTKCIKRNGGALKKSSEYSESFNPTFSFLKSSFLLNLVSKKENWNSCFF